MERERDSQLDRLAAQLREEGIPPERDLWPDIDAAISRREGRGFARRTPPWWRLVAAVAALVIIAVGIGTRVPDRGGPSEASLPVYDLAQETSQPTVQVGMAAIDRALVQLEKSLAADPDNLSLSRLVLMVHKTRSELLCKSLTSGLRVG